MELKNKFVTLEKLEDLRYNGNHPNGINTGYKLKGWLLEEPIEGQAVFLFATKSIQSTPSGWTSVIKNVDMENMLLETKNSMYKITVDENAKDFTLEDLQAALNKKD